MQHATSLWGVSKSLLSENDSHNCTDSGETCWAFERGRTGQYCKGCLLQCSEGRIQAFDKVDKLDIRVSDLLKEVTKIEENEARRLARYPPSVSARNSNNNNSNNNNNQGQMEGTSYKGHHYKDKKPDVIGVRMVNTDDPDNGAAVAKNDVKSPEDDISIWNDEYYYCLRQQADDAEHCMGTFYNCREPGHC